MYKKKKKNVKKFRKTFNTRVIRSKQNYSIEEISELLNVHPNTVSAWLKEGLPKIDSLQPTLVFGQNLIDFLKARNNNKKRPCASDELFCCKCQAARRSRNNIVRIMINNCRTNMVGICEVCGAQINKAISPNKIDFYKNIFNVETVHPENLIEFANTSATTNKNQGAKNG